MVPRAKVPVDAQVVLPGLVPRGAPACVGAQVRAIPTVVVGHQAARTAHATYAEGSVAAGPKLAGAGIDDRAATMGATDDATVVPGLKSGGAQVGHVGVHRLLLLLAAKERWPIQAHATSRERLPSATTKEAEGAPVVKATAPDGEPIEGANDVCEDPSSVTEPTVPTHGITSGASP